MRYVLFREVGRLGKAGVGGSLDSWVLQTQDKSSLRGNANILLHLTRIARNGEHIRKVTLFAVASLGNGVYSFCHRRHRRRVSNPCRLGCVLGSLEEILLEVLQCCLSLLYEGHELVTRALREHLLRECNEAVVPYVLDSTIGKLGARW